MAVTRTGPSTIRGLRTTLPYSYYSDPSTLASERKRVFGPSWQYAGNTYELPERGSVVPVEINGVPIILTRSDSGDIYALVNVCSHRGSILCDTSMTASVIRCPYHAWTYDLAGNLRRAPRSERESNFDVSEHGLERVALETWGPFIFVSTAACLLYTSPSPRDQRGSRMPSSA